jgi:hypothetical protein
MQLHRPPIQASVDRRRQRRRCVHNKEVAYVNELREFREARVHKLAAAAACNQQRDIGRGVPAKPGARVRLGALGGGGDHRGSSASSLAR